MLGLVDSCQDDFGSMDAVLRQLRAERGPVDVLFAPCSRGVLWGTIHATNQASLATALRHGRKIVQTHYWLLAGSPVSRGGLA